MNIKNIFKPKVLATITIVSIIMYLGISIYLQHILFPIIQGILYGYVYIIVYLSVILFAKKKNIKVLNIILLINLIMALFMYFFTDTIVKINIFLLYYLLIAIIALGILLKKKIPYKPIMISSIGILITCFLLTIYELSFGKWFYTGNDTLNVYLIIYYLAEIFKSVGLCSFTIFMYQYGKSISERSNYNE